MIIIKKVLASTWTLPICNQQKTGFALTEGRFIPSAIQISNKMGIVVKRAANPDQHTVYYDHVPANKAQVVVFTSTENNRPIMIKLAEYNPIIWSQSGQATCKALFDMEATGSALGATVKHEHIVPSETFVIPRTGGGTLITLTPIYPMDAFTCFVDGDHNPIDTLMTLRGIGKALGHIHRMGIIHRDVKPENILIVWDKKDGHLYGKALLTDFGYAVMAPLAQPYPVIHEPETSCGTPGYVSKGAQQGIYSPHSDFYALLMTLFVCITKGYTREEDTHPMIAKKIYTIMQQMNQSNQRYTVTTFMRDFTTCLRGAIERPDNQKGFSPRPSKTP